MEAEPRPEPPSVAGTMLFIAILKLALAAAGFERTWRCIRAWSERRPLAHPIADAAVRQSEYVVALAAALYPGRAACLERSLTLYWHLRRRGVDVRYRMGVQAYPFMAHAWIEHRGVPINDIPEHVRRFRLLDAAGAAS